MYTISILIFLIKNYTFKSLESFKLFKHYDFFKINQENKKNYAKSQKINERVSKSKQKVNTCENLLNGK